MTEQEIHKLLEIQYLKGRIDELHKAIPNITSLERQRKLDARLNKYYNKLKSTDEIAYHLYQVERANTLISKAKSIGEISELLQEVHDHIEDPVLKIKLEEKLLSYKKHIL
jgi:hypothetical protein